MRRLLISTLALLVLPQAPLAPTNDLPNRCQTIENYLKLPDGREAAR